MKCKKGRKSPALVYLCLIHIHQKRVYIKVIKELKISERNNQHNVTRKNSILLNYYFTSNSRSPNFFVSAWENTNE